MGILDACHFSANLTACCKTCLELTGTLKIQIFRGASKVRDTFFQRREFFYGCFFSGLRTRVAQRSMTEFTFGVIKPMKPHRFFSWLTASVAPLLILLTLTLADEAGTKPLSAVRETTVAALRPVGLLVGEWKGVGQPKRGSNTGAWSEKAQAAWKFEDDIADLVVTFESGRQFQTASFSLAEDRKTPVLILQPLKGDPITLTRTLPAGEKSGDESWIFESSADQFPRTRTVVRIISDIRVTILFEEKRSELASYRRLSEIGLTRAGSRLASATAGERECIVTGGLGSIKVSHEGRTYYVCCGGCKQVFDNDPAGTLEAWRERLKEARGK